MPSYMKPVLPFAVNLGNPAADLVCLFCSASYFNSFACQLFPNYDVDFFIVSSYKLSSRLWQSIHKGNVAVYKLLRIEFM